MADSIDFQKGTLDLMVLKAVSRGPAHGYAIGRWIEQTSDALRCDEGTLYPALYRLEERGFVVSEIGVTKTKRRAKFYRITPSGRKRLVSAQDEWIRFSNALAAVLKAEPDFA
jgi:PadR family transcriptional regulator, regulatory protein PadR